MIRALLAVLFAALPMAAQHYYLAGSRPGLVVGLAAAPNLPASLWVSLPVPVPPTAAAQAQAQAALDSLCRTTLEVAPTHDPNLSGGCTDLWVLRRVSDGWTPAARVTLGGYLISSGLVAAPVDVSEPIKTVYDTAFAIAVSSNAGWIATMGPTGGQNAWIIGRARMVQYFALRESLANRQSEQQAHEKKTQDADDRRALKLDLQGAKSEEEVHRIYDAYLAKRGLKMKWKGMRLSRIDEPDEDD